LISSSASASTSRVALVTFSTLSAHKPHDQPLGKIQFAGVYRAASGTCASATRRRTLAHCSPKRRDMMVSDVSDAAGLAVTTTSVLQLPPSAPAHQCQKKAKKAV
jgi:hypothetical protein